MATVPQLFLHILIFVLNLLLLRQYFGKLVLETNLHRPLQRFIDFLQMEDLVLQLLDLIYVANVLAIRLHLPGWLRILVN